ncbi:MAG: alpha-ribazole phosphatase family protein [Zetaproteobacteria bacterium]|nr:MAG: alpha-ribazole phosphatase family protein [Zetaproteobacteria bacterium]
MTTTIDLLRHGALEGGIRYRGNTEAALTKAGRAAMNAVWQKLDGSIDVIVTSPMSRCRQSAELWAKEAGIPCRVEPNIHEMDYGAWEGLSKEEIETRFPGMLSRWRENPAGMRIPEAERIEDFARRVLEGWKTILCESTGKHVLVVAHSGSLRVILAHVLGAPLPTIRRFAMPYASWSRVIDDHGKLCLEYLNIRI